MLSNTALRKVARSLLQRGALCQRTFGSTADLLAPKMVYTDTDEAPYLATYSLLPVIKRFAEPAGVNVVKRTFFVDAEGNGARVCMFAKRSIGAGEELQSPNAACRFRRRKLRCDLYGQFVQSDFVVLIC